MSFPVEAFVRVRAVDTTCGTFVLLRGAWAFRCRFSPADGPNEKLLWMTGENAGQISGIPDEIGLSIAPRFKVQTRFSDPSNVVSTYDTPLGSVVLPDGGGLQYWGHIMGSQRHAYGFDSSGEDVQADKGHWPAPFLHTNTFEVWLEMDGSPIGEKPLFSVHPL
ncbi:hypothetical protein D3C81_955980 [compost metagenome]